MKNKTVTTVGITLLSVAVIGAAGLVSVSPPRYEPWSIVEDQYGNYRITESHGVMLNHDFSSYELAEISLEAIKRQTEQPSTFKQSTPKPSIEPPLPEQGDGKTMLDDKVILNDKEVPTEPEPLELPKPPKFTFVPVPPQILTVSQ